MAVSGCVRVFPSFDCRSDPDFSGFPKPEKPSAGRFSGKFSSVPIHGSFGASALSSLIFRFPPNFVRQLSIKARRNCSNIGVAQVVAASWSDKAAAGPPAAAATAAIPLEVAAVDEVVAVEELALVVEDGSSCNNNDDVQFGDLTDNKTQFLSSDGSLAVHAGTSLRSYFVSLVAK